MREQVNKHALLLQIPGVRFSYLLSHTFIIHVMTCWFVLAVCINALKKCIRDEIAFCRFFWQYPHNGFRR